MSLKRAPRICGILARNKPVAVIFRRGPSKLVQLLKWDLRTDEITAGQWFKGRVYEHRCDLSPDGEYLVYFAASQKPPHYSWTAISKPPFFTALALWPKGDAWGGGGLFDADGKGMTLNHQPLHMNQARGFKLPSSFRIRPHGQYSGGGEDDPIWSDRLIRDGWVLTAEGERKKNQHGSKIWIEYLSAKVWVKYSKNQQASIAFELHGINEEQGPWYVHKLRYKIDNEVCSIGRCDWADITAEGVIYYAQNGRLFKKSSGTDVHMVADLTDHVFKAVEPPGDALRWGQ